MRRPLSSPLTFVWKFVVPGLLAAGVCYIIIIQCLDKFRNRDGTPLSYGELFLPVALGTAILAWVIWSTNRLKRVAVDDRALYVSNYRSEICIPLTEVTEVNESDGDRRNFSVTIQLRQASVFGQLIVFRPRFRLYWSGLHPSVLELRSLCARAKAEAGVQP